MKSISRFALVSMIVATLFLAVPRAHASDVSVVIMNTINKVLAIVKEPLPSGKAKAKERRDRLSKTIAGLFSYNEMAKRSLGRYWRDRTPEEKAEFTEVFTRLVEASYIEKIEKYTDEKVVYKNAKIKNEVAVVKTRIVKKSGGIIPISYKLKQFDKGEWQVYDIVIVGVSMVRNYRARFTNILNSGLTYDEFVDQLKEKAKTV